MVRALLFATELRAIEMPIAFIARLMKRAPSVLGGPVLLARALLRRLELDRQLRQEPLTAGLLVEEAVQPALLRREIRAHELQHRRHGVKDLDDPI